MLNNGTKKAPLKRQLKRRGCIKARGVPMKVMAYKLRIEIYHVVSKIPMIFCKSRIKPSFSESQNTPILVGVSK